ncbi:MAG: energy-coupling factor transporter transmembrane protein EcfT [Proteobacteria bacterium]|nr:energy-coupling factor transporter transmembrane protein EcfT [Pseudomonadota bacterium]MBU1584689.1 energy-coupling factor transporter transmembrane protein EcfT [Pseudomonadota bacterium]MBU2454148.1 energy-coupling factor transporter transmembrane protein EcfT [Pseudomonadota bacterium]MBU2628116.1 energy-coupling factor transporter transmembrane protein EcfT [Pseudomonadota bacterium]
MAQLTPFTYRQGSSILHLLDARCKFFAICLVSMSMLSARLPVCLFYFLILLFFLKKAGLKFFTTMGSIKYFLMFLFFIFAARALIVEGEIIFSFHGISITKQGLNEGFLVAFKFFLVMLTGLVFSATTKPSSVKTAVQWFLKPIPFVPEKRVAVMISLSLGFMPIIAQKARDISDAQKARCADLEKNPVKKIIRLVLPLLKKTFLSADNLVLAMESRCYTDDRTDPEFAPSGKEIFFLVCSILISVGLISL